MNVRRYLVCMSVVLLLVAGCTVAPETEPAPPAGGAETPDATALATRRPPLTPCDVPAVAVPTPPATIPRYAQLDETTGLHVTGTAPEEVDLDAWRLTVDGAVATPLSLTYDELRCMARSEAEPVLVCPGFFEDTARWAGVPLRDVLEAAGAPPSGVRVRFYGVDGYDQLMPIETAMASSALVAYEWEGEPLPLIHGFPVRLVLPGNTGSLWVKWLYRIEVE